MLELNPKEDINSLDETKSKNNPQNNSNTTIHTKIDLLLHILALLPHPVRRMA